MTEPPVVAGVLRIPITDLIHGPNARGDLGNVDDLAASLLTLGQQQPLLVEPHADGKWSVFDGNRRLKAGRAAGLAHMLAIPRKTTMTEQQRILRQLGMHTTGRGFDPIAEAKAIEWLMFADDGPHMDRAAIAHALSKSETWVKNRVDLLQLAPDEQVSVARGTLSVSLAVTTIAGRRNEAAGGATRRRPTAAPAAQCAQGSRCGCKCHKRNQEAT